MRNPLGRILLVTLVAFGLATPSRAYNWLDYFLSTPGVCTAGNPSNPGTYTYSYSAGKTCNVPGRGNVPLYLLYKGGWADENFVAHNGWLYLASERHPNLCGTTAGFRIFEDINGAYGLPYAKLTTAGYQTWNTPDFTLLCGSSCNTNNLDIFQAGGTPNEQALLGYIWDKLYDCRSGSCQGPIPMEVVMTRSHLYPHNSGCGSHHDAIEEYWYGRADITNDGVNNPQSIGFVRFVDQIYNHATCSYDTGPATGWNAYLKNCSVTASCPLC